MRDPTNGWKGTIERSEIPKGARLLHPDDKIIDSVTLELRERWKESDLSGDEWRFSYVAKLSRKGVVLFTNTANSPEYLAAAINVALSAGLAEIHGLCGWERCDDPRVPLYSRYSPVPGLCCQPGCSEPSVAWAVLEKLWDPTCRHSHPNPNGKGREFCENHIWRGDCALDDADINYSFMRIREAEDKDEEPDEDEEPSVALRELFRLDDKGEEPWWWSTGGSGPSEGVNPATPPAADSDDREEAKAGIRAGLSVEEAQRRSFLAGIREQLAKKKPSMALLLAEPGVAEQFGIYSWLDFLVALLVALMVLAIWVVFGGVFDSK